MIPSETEKSLETWIIDYKFESFFSFLQKTLHKKSWHYLSLVNRDRLLFQTRLHLINPSIKHPCHPCTSSNTQFSFLSKSNWSFDFTSKKKPQIKCQNVVFFPSRSCFFLFFPAVAFLATEDESYDTKRRKESSTLH